MTAAVKLPLSALQQELLEFYAHQTTNTELLDIKNILSQYYANKAMDAMDALLEEREYTNDTMIEWANSHDRVSSKSKH